MQKKGVVWHKERQIKISTPADLYYNKAQTNSHETGTTTSLMLTESGREREKIAQAKPQGGILNMVRVC